MNKIIKALLAVVVFVVCVGLIIYGQKNIGVNGLCIMLVGLVGLLGLLYTDNRNYQ